MLKDEEFQAYLKDVVESSRDWVDTEFSHIRQKSLLYFRGGTHAPSQPGRSKAVSKDVYEAVSGILPDFLRLFLEDDHPVEWTPRPDVGDPILAKSQTEYCAYVVKNKHNQFNLYYDFLFDALTSLLGVWKIRWDERKEPEFGEMDGLTKEEVAVIEAMDNTDVLEKKEYTVFSSQEYEKEGTMVDSEYEETLYDIKYREIKSKACIKIDCVPPEDFIMDARATGPDDFSICGEDTWRTVEDLVEEGFDFNELVEMASNSPSENGDQDDTREARSQSDDSYSDSDSYDGKKWVRFVEVICKIDRDGDGLREMVRVILMGSELKIMEEETINYNPYIWWSSIRIPHSPIGADIASSITDIQDQKTALIRGLLDNLYQVTNPDKWVVANQVNMQDALSTAHGKIIRMRQPGMYGHMSTPWVGDEVLPALNYLSEEKSRRTGFSDAAMGLAPEQLQSSSVVGVASTIQAARARVEAMARSFAEGALMPLYRAILKISLTSEDQYVMMKISGGKWKEVNTDEWNLEMDLESHVGLGRPDKENKITALREITMVLKEATATLGPINPIGGIMQIRNAIKDINEENKLDNGRYLVSDEEAESMIQQMMEQSAEGSKQPDPEMMKVQADIQRKQMEAEAKIEIDKMKAEADIKMQREKMLAELELKKAELQIEASLEPVKMAMKTKDGQGNVPRS